MELRQMLLRCTGPSVSLQDQEDCAASLLDAGFTDAAQILRNVVQLQTGFPADAPHTDGGSSLELAIEQLAHVMALAGDFRPLSHRDDGCGDAVAGGGAGVLPMPPMPPGPVPDGFVTLCERLLAVLRRSLDAAARQELGTVLTLLQAGVLRHPGFDARRHVGLPISQLGLGVAFDCFRRFLVHNLDLAHGPFGSTGVFHAAARLAPPGLGPWFRNTVQVIRGGRDVFGLIQLVAGKQPDGTVNDDALERWSFLLSQHMPDAALHDLVDDLADIGAMRAICAIGERVARRPGRETGVLHAVRDAGLDNGDLGLASWAQKLVVRRQPLSGAEWIVLGEVEATAGNPVEAEQAFIHALRLEPWQAGGKERLLALRDGTFQGFAVQGGFGTPAHRKRLRYRRRLARPPQPSGSA